MLKLRDLKLLRATVKSTSRTLSTRSAPKISDEYTEKPEYPPILDLTFRAKKKRKAESWHQEVQDLATVEEKLIKVNMPRYYGFRSVMLGDERVPYNCRPMLQHYTRTHFEEITSLPAEGYSAAGPAIDSYAKSIKENVQDLIGFAVDCFRQKTRDTDCKLSRAELDRMLGAEIVTQINRLLLNALRADCQHLSDVEIDLNPRHEAFWFVGGVTPPTSVRKMRDGVEWQKEFVDDPVDRAVQYVGSPYLALRHKLPLKPVRAMQEESQETRDKIPIFKYDARTIGFAATHRHGTTIPGFWPGSPQEFGLLSYQCRDYLLRNPDIGPDTKDLLHAHGIQSSYAWLLGQACYQGFSTYNDITYPLSTQTVITNGQFWSFYVYQLNTTVVHSNCVYDNPKVNYCWGTDQLKLYEEIDSTGKCIGFNDDVLKYLLHFYTNKPSERTDTAMKPYLGVDEQKIADITDDKRRAFLERTYKHLMANRPRHRLAPETYAWEKIYKIDNNTRPLEAKRRYFELDINPFQRRLDDHFNVYIPRDLRPLGRRSKKKWEDKYYP